MAKPVANSSASKSSHHVPPPTAPIGRKPILGKLGLHSPSEKCCFSFRYWSQIDFFGLDGKNGLWFISLMERIRDISRESANRIQTDSALQNSLRYHNINWGQTNIPIQRKDLVSLPSEIRENDNDYPIYQFSISKGLGRIAGFWEGHIFNIVLLDPYHNLQPSKAYDYAVTKTKEMPSEHEMLLAQLNFIKSAPASCAHGQCSTQAALSFLHLENKSFGIVYLDAEYFKKAKELMQDGKAKSIEELIELGVLSKS